MPTITTTVTSAETCGAVTTVTTTEATPSAPVAVENDLHKLLNDVFADWFAGTLPQTCAKYFSPSYRGLAHCDAIPNSGFKQYDGHAGLLEWLVFLDEEFEWPKFDQTLMSLPNGNVMCVIDYISKGKKTGKVTGELHDIQEISLAADGLIGDWRFNWSNPSAFVEIMQTPMMLVKEAYDLWSVGKLEENAKTVMADDLKILAQADAIPNTGWKEYNGNGAEFSSWLAFLQEFEFPVFTPVFNQLADGRVCVNVTWQLKNKATGSQTGVFEDVHIWTTSGDKITQGKFYMYNQSEMAATLP